MLWGSPSHILSVCLSNLLLVHHCDLAVKYIPCLARLLYGSFILILGMCSPSLTYLGGIHLWMCSVFFTCNFTDVSLYSTSAGGRRLDMGTVFSSSNDRRVIMLWLLMLSLRLRVLTTNLITPGQWLHPPPLRRWVLSTSQNFAALQFLLHIFR